MSIQPTWRKRVSQAIAIAIGLSVLLSGCIPDPRSQLDLTELINMEPSDGQYSQFQDAVDVTDKLCPETASCVQAVETSELRILRFETIEQARTYAKTLGAKGAHSHWVVVEFLHETPQTQKDEITQRFDGWHVSEDGGWG